MVMFHLSQKKTKDYTTHPRLGMYGAFRFNGSHNNIGRHCVCLHSDIMGSYVTPSLIASLTSRKCCKEHEGAPKKMKAAFYEFFDGFWRIKYHPARQRYHKFGEPPVLRLVTLVPPCSWSNRVRKAV